MRSSDIRYQGDGRSLVGYLAYDENLEVPGPAVLVSHEGPGRTAHTVQIAGRLAGLGYVAFAPDYNGGGVALPAEQVRDRLRSGSGRRRLAAGAAPVPPSAVALGSGARRRARPRR